MRKKREPGICHSVPERTEWGNRQMQAAAPQGDQRQKASSVLSLFQRYSMLRAIPCA